MKNRSYLCFGLCTLFKADPKILLALKLLWHISQKMDLRHYTLVKA